MSIFGDLLRQALSSNHPTPPLPHPQHHLKRFGVLQLELAAAISGEAGDTLLRARMRVGAHHPAIHALRLYLCPHAIQPDLHIAIRLEMIHRAADRPLSTRTRTPSKRASRTSQEQPRESGKMPTSANANQRRKRQMPTSPFGPRRYFFSEARYSSCRW